MNKLQSAAHTEGFIFAASGFQSRKPLDQVSFQSWVNACLHNDQTVEQVLQLHDRDSDGNLTTTTTLKAIRAEMCGYRLMGYFTATEAIRSKLDAAKVAVTLDKKAKT